MWGNPRDKEAVPSGCLLSERHCNVVVTKAGQEGMNLFQGKVLKLEVRRDTSALVGVSGSGAAAAPCLEPVCPAVLLGCAGRMRC